MRQLAVILCVLVLCAALGTLDQAHAKKLYWGIGSGFTFMNAEGDQGLDVPVAGGPVVAEIDLDPGDFNDLMETAFGFGGYVTDGTWMVMYLLQQMKLGDEPSGTLPSGATYAGDWFYEVFTTELLVGYPAYRHPKGTVTIRPYGGVRYMKHTVGVDLEIVGTSTIMASREDDHNWTDVVIGAAVDVQLAPKWTWSSQLDAGFGSSEGTFGFNTGVSWRFWKYMSAGPNFMFQAADYRNGEKGDTDFYLYDANEFGGGITFMFHF